MFARACCSCVFAHYLLGPDVFNAETLHYIDTPDWACNYKHSRDCANDVCVTGALYNFTSQVVSIVTASVALFVFFFFFLFLILLSFVLFPLFLFVAVDAYFLNNFAWRLMCWTRSLL